MVRDKVILSTLLLLLAAVPAFAADSATAGTGVNRPIRDKWAVVIGISKFSNPNIPKLQYPSKDAQDFCDFLVKSGNFSKDHVLLLKDEGATRVRILDAFGDGWLPRRVMGDDLVVVFISSHGSSADGAGENFIIAYDTDPNHPYSTGIRLQDLATEVTKRTGCDRLVLLLDACHSGAAAQGQKGLVRPDTNFKLENITGAGQLVISSSAPDEVSWESKRYPNGVFTKNLIQSLQVKGKSTNISDAYKALRNGVEQEVRFDRVASQTPQMLSKWKGEDLSLCAPPTEPRTVLPELPETPVVTEQPQQPQVIAQRPVQQMPPVQPPPIQPVVQQPPVQPAIQNQYPPQSNPYVRPTSVPQTSYVPETSYQPTTGYRPTSGYPLTTDRTQSYTASPYDKNARYAANAAADQRARVATARTRESNEWIGAGVLIPAMMVTTWTSNGGDPTLESGTRLISPQELLRLSERQLTYLLNECFARHGRGFQQSDIQRYYSSRPWYRQDPDYHWMPTDPRVIARGGHPDDSQIVNEGRTPKQWANLINIRLELGKRKSRSSLPQNNF